MAGNTPEGTERLVELSHDKLGLQRGLVITTQRLEIVDGEVAAATLAAWSSATRPPEL